MNFYFFPMFKILNIIYVFKTIRYGMHCGINIFVFIKITKTLLRGPIGAVSRVDTAHYFIYIVSMYD
jgi:hypothetical protein